MTAAIQRARLSAAWRMKAAELHERGHFASYSAKQLNQVLQRGYVGQWLPDHAITVARNLAQKGLCFVTPRFHDQMRDNFGLVGEDVRLALLAILDELPPENYEPPSNLGEPPGLPFIFRCATLNREIYFKFQLAGTQKKPQVLFWSCHPPLY